MKTLNIIGSGQLAKTLGYLFNKHRRYKIQHIYSRTFAKAQLAQKFLACGEAVSCLQEFKPADAFLLAVPDDQLQHVSLQLAKYNLIKKNDIVFHCSGALSSSELFLLAEQQALVASAHPIKNLSNPEIDVKNFAGIYCSLEGDEKACSILEKDLRAIGAEVIKIKAEQKLLYHAAIVMASNYLVSLLEISLKTFQTIEIDQATALNLLQPIISSVCERIFAVGTHKALTGPIVRGDVNIVKEEINALKNSSAEIADLYQSLGKIALDITKKNSSLPEDVIKKFIEILHKI